jgi:hypothetical protein
MDRPIPADKPAGARSRDTWLVALLYTVLTFLLAYPLSFNLTSLRLPTGPDGDLCMWILAWDTHAFTHQLGTLFDANIYFPQHLTLAYAENLIGSALFAAPVLWLTGDLTLASNVIGLLSTVLCGLGAYVLARRLGVGLPGAVMSGLIFAFSPPRFFRIGQLHLTAVQWIPFGLAALHAYLDGGRRRDLRLAAGFFSLQALSSGYGAVFMSVSMAGLLAYRVVLGEPVRIFRRLRDLGLTGAMLLTPTILVFLPYRAVQLEVGLRRGLGGWGVEPSSFIASPSHFQHAVLTAIGAEGVYRTANAFLFPGYLPLVLAAAALFWRRRRLLAGPDGCSQASSSQQASPGGQAHGPHPDFDRVPGSGQLGRARAAGGAPGRHAAVGDASMRPARPLPEPVPASRPAPRGASPAWFFIARVTSIAAVLVMALAVTVSERGPLRLRIGSMTLLSARDAGRLWMMCLALVAVRAGLVRVAPFGLVFRLRQALNLVGRALGASGRFAGRRLRDLQAARNLAGAVGRAFSLRMREAGRAVRSRAEPARRKAASMLARFAPIRRWADVQRRDMTVFYGILTILSFWLAVGPPFGLWQFVYWIPGFSFIRECSRFTIVGLLGIAVLAGMGFDRLTAALTAQKRLALAIAAGVFLIAEFAAMPLAVQPTTAVVPAIDRWLDSQPKPFVVAEVPSPRPSQMGPFERQQAAFMIHSTAHWQKTVHGYSGWRTPLHEALYWEMLDFPNEKVLESLSSLGVTHIVVHTELYPPGEWERVLPLVDGFGEWLHLEHVEGTGRVYTLHRPGRQGPVLNRGAAGR